MTDSSYVSAVRESYDTVADDYAKHVPAPAELDALSRAMLAAFAELVRSAGPGVVADLGCGPGKVTAHLVKLGVEAFGVDVSPRMIELARAAHPELRFSVGSMTALEVGDGELGGILAHYSVHHTPPELLPVVFAEFHRTLAPGGQLMIVTRVVAAEYEHVRLTHAYGEHPAPFDSHLLPADRIAELLEQAGLVVTARLVREPGEGMKRQVASLVAGKPGAAGSRGRWGGVDSAVCH
ncbi:class I SAM-dependent methyltransferase [Kitasatospora sp. NBC_01287]|uniref:class I SAM-dependent methyltransferase n=1 Tax=Kitasatospora sp. NBC_01287 TaxID=2903573 RepID=UPI00224E65F0|nr:class I SAM-dependent methyltransferase [Kitasatospora sp. NBC_01287]MCX4749747.1 class I SAM-dependent methyltransferase [Kitasatospora sp. NBC_01287]